ncbi:MAG TPA: hypothetical protein VIY49_16260 [Bryobacteraceae bacterium]
MTNRRQLGQFCWGAVWAAIGGLQPALLDIAHDLYAYRDSDLDWQHIGFMTAGGVIMGLAAYWQRQKALFTPVPVEEVESRAPAAAVEAAAH